jgi:hypothetical protein
MAGLYNNSPSSIWQALEKYLTAIRAMGHGTGHSRGALPAHSATYPVFAKYQIRTDIVSLLLLQS